MREESMRDVIWEDTVDLVRGTCYYYNVRRHVKEHHKSSLLFIRRKVQIQPENKT